MAGAPTLYTARAPVRLLILLSAANGRYPTAAVKRGDVPFTVSAKGELQGGNSEMLTAPMTGGGAMSLPSFANRANW